MKRLTAVAALLCACSPTHAAEWVRMSTIDINQHWYDRSKIFVDGDLVNGDNPTLTYPFGRDTLLQWGPAFPGL